MNRLINAAVRIVALCASIGISALIVIAHAVDRSELGAPPGAVSVAHVANAWPARAIPYLSAATVLVEYPQR